MKRAIIMSIIAVLLCQGIAAACGILNPKDVQIGENKGIQGLCSNNVAPIACTFVKGEGITCDGPAGSYNGYDLNALIFSACGCSEQEEEMLRERKSI